MVFVVGRTTSSGKNEVGPLDFSSSSITLNGLLDTRRRNGCRRDCAHRLVSGSCVVALRRLVEIRSEYHLSYCRLVFGGAESQANAPV